MGGFISKAQVENLFNERGQPTSQQVGKLAEVSYDVGLLRPVIQNDGRVYCYLRTGKPKTGKDGGIIRNAKGHPIPERQWVPAERLVNRGLLSTLAINAALPYQAWQRIDTSILTATRKRLQAWTDLAGANTYGGFDGMGVTGLIRDTMTDAGGARVDMDTLSNDLNDAPLFTPDILPLPVIHAGFQLSERRLAVSRNTGMPLDTTMATQAGERCAETLEDMTIGVTDFSGVTISNTTTFDTNAIYGYRNHPDVITKTDVTASSSFVAETFLTDVIAMIELARAQNYFGPFVLYYSTSWDQYMNYDYWVFETSGGAAPTKTVRQRVMELTQISRMQMLDRYSSTDELLLVGLGDDSIRAVDGMDWTTVQWEENGGARLVYRVMGIKVPEIRSRFIGTSVTASARKAPIVKGTTS